MRRALWTRMSRGSTNGADADADEGIGRAGRRRDADGADGADAATDGRTIDFVASERRRDRDGIPRGRLMR